VSGGADRDDGGILPVAAPDHLDLLRAEHDDGVGPARVEEIGPAQRRAHEPDRPALAGDDRVLGDDRTLPAGLVVAGPDERHPPPAGREPPGMQSRPLVRVHNIDVRRHQPRHLRHAEPEAADELGAVRDVAGGARPYGSDLHPVRDLGELAPRLVVVADDRHPMTPLLKANGQLQHQPGAAPSTGLTADVIAHERDVHRFHAARGGAGCFVAHSRRW
jgi:hypothetical protein